MTDTESASPQRDLRAGECLSQDNGERVGRSAGGRLVLMRRRRTTSGFVVTVDAQPRPEVPAETLSTEWAAANAAFDRMMKAY